MRVRYFAWFDSKHERTEFINLLKMCIRDRLTPEETAANNLRTNLANGTYVDITDEEEEKEAKPVSYTHLDVYKRQEIIS